MPLSSVHYRQRRRVLRTTVCQEGCLVQVCKTGGIIKHKRDHGRYEILAHLQDHPSEAHRNAARDCTCVISSNLTSLVLQPLELPKDADPSMVYVGQAHSSTSGVTESQPFVRAVWFQPSTADTISGRSNGSHMAATKELCAAWRGKVALVDGDAKLSSTQPASGAYTELGVGTMAGRGRTSVTFATGNSVLSFARNG